MRPLAYVLAGLTVFGLLGWPAVARARRVRIDTEARLVRELMRPHRAGTRYRFGKGLVTRAALDADWITIRNRPLLRRLTWLKHLSLERSKVRSFRFLARLKRLESLDLGHTSIRSLKPLARLQALRKLDLSSTRVRSVKPLDGCTSLMELSLVDTRVTDLTPLAKTSLRRLELGASRLAKLPRMDGLAVDELRITDAAARLDLGGLRKVQITRLVLDATGVKTLEGLSGHPTLTRLSLRRTQVSRRAIRALLAKRSSLQIVTPKGRRVGRVLFWVRTRPRLAHYPCLTGTGDCPRETFAPGRRPVYRWIAP